MRELVLKLYDQVGIKSDRTKNILKHVGWSTFFKVGSIIANFLLVPLTINYLDTDNYGIWLTLSSFIGWFSFFDIGLGNGLRNKFAEAKALGNLKGAQAFVSTAYYTIGSISFGLFMIFVVMNQFINWADFFNTNATLQKDLRILLPVVFGFFALQLVVKLITSIYQADQNHSIQGKIQFISQSLSLLAIWVLTKSEHGSLVIFGTVFSALPVVILVALNFIGFYRRFQSFRPKLSLWKKEYLKEITGLGFKFFIIQMAGVVLFSTDNFIISRLFGPDDVVPYNVTYKYFSIITMVFTILTTPYWSSFTEAYAKKDFEWIKISVSNIQKIWLFIPISLVGMVFLSNWFYEFWVGDKVFVPLRLSVAMAFYVTLLSYNMIYSNFINGVGKIKLNLIFSLVSMTINIPLSIYFGKYLGWGSTGVILATCFCLFYAMPFLPIQYKKLIQNNASGIWNK